MKPETATISNSEKIGLISNLSTMLGAGIPILEVVNSLLEDAKGGTKHILEMLRDDLSQGKQLYITFGKFPLVFDKVTVNVIKASEEAGTLDVTLRDLRENIRKEIEFTDKIKSSLLYPVFIVTVFFAVFLVILLVVVPKIATVFVRLRTELPIPTRLLIFLSNVLLNYTSAIIVGSALLMVLLVFLYREKRGLLFRIFFSFPLISNLVHEIDLTRFSRSMYLLLYSGIPITLALELASDVVIQGKTRTLILHAREMLLAGKKLSESLRASRGRVPMLMIKLIEAGERTGSLDRSMQDVSEYYDYQVSNMLKTVIALLEPVMLVLVGVVIGGMMVAIVAPIYGLIGKVGVR
ncbi:MAG: type II secretion system F family protein [Patescibacteria group bacterium]